MQLSYRLKEVASMVTKGLVIADIGTDHGYVPIYLVKENISPFVYAMDYREGPLKRASAHILEEGLSSKITTRISDGFENLLEGEAGGAIIAGMGGPLIVDILKAGRKKVEKMDMLVLSPQSKIGDVRKYIVSCGYSIEEERCVFEGGKYYFILKINPKEKDLSVWTKEEYEYGKYLINKKDETLKKFLEKEKNTLERVLENHFSVRTREKLDLVVKSIERIR